MSSYPKYYKYTKPFDSVAKQDLQRGTVEYTRFGTEYFSGANVSIYFGEVLVDKIFSLQFEMQEQIIPVYGYASYTFDAVARGQRIINGSFAIYFQEAAYLHQVLKIVENNAVPENVFKYKKNQEEATIEQILGQLKYKTQGEFSRIADSYEEAIWGDPSVSGEFGDSINNRGSNPYFTSKPYKSDPKNIYAPGFNIIISYGPEARRQANNLGQLDPKTTVQSLTEVHISGVSTVVDGSGQPLYEQYTFVAKDLNSNIHKQDYVKETASVQPDNTSKSRPLLSMNKNNSDVYLEDKPIAELQNLLTICDYYSGKIDGLFGKGTDKAVRSFQEAYRLTVDGVVAQQTWAALLREAGDWQNKGYFE